MLGRVRTHALDVRCWPLLIVWCSQIKSQLSKEETKIVSHSFLELIKEKKCFRDVNET